jgi:hypothetical protein
MHSDLQSGNFRRRFPHQRNWTNPAGALTKLKVGRSGKRGKKSSWKNVLRQTGAWESHICRIPVRFPCRQSSRSLDLTTHLYLVPKIRKCGSYAPAQLNVFIQWRWIIHTGISFVPSSIKILYFVFSHIYRMAATIRVILVARPSKRQRRHGHGCRRSHINSITANVGGWESWRVWLPAWGISWETCVVGYGCITHC